MISLIRDEIRRRRETLPYRLKKMRNVAITVLVLSATLTTIETAEEFREVGIVNSLYEQNNGGMCEQSPKTYFGRFGQREEVDRRIDHLSAKGIDPYIPILHYLRSKVGISQI